MIHLNKVTAGQIKARKCKAFRGMAMATNAKKM
jgi:hypothetical protein